jgi:hypothetical protein
VMLDILYINLLLDFIVKKQESSLLGTTIVEDVGPIDNSHPERVTHEEYVGKDPAKARFLIPLKVNRLEQRFEDIDKKLFDFSNTLEELLDKFMPFLDFTRF